MSDVDVDGLAAKLAAALGKIKGAAASDDDDIDGEGSGRIPRSRLQREIDKRKALADTVSELQGQVASLSQGYASQIERLQAEAAEQVKGIGQRHGEDLALVELGVKDPLGRTAVRQAWEAAPKEARGKSAAEWWGQQVTTYTAAAAGEEGVEAPTVPGTLVGYLPKIEAPAEPQRNGATRPPGPPAKRQPMSLESVNPEGGMAGLLSQLRGDG